MTQALAPPISFDPIIQLVLDSVTSPQSKRAYEKALRNFLTWYRDTSPPQGFTKATVQTYRALLVEAGLSASTINIRLTAIRRLAQEASDNGLLHSAIAQGISHVKGVKSEGVRTGNWLTLQQAEALLSLPDAETLRGKRDRALLAVLIGCGLRREEAANLKLEHIQMRDARWVIVDIRGKGNRTRSVPMPAWCKSAIDVWWEATEYPLRRCDICAACPMCCKCEEGGFEDGVPYCAHPGVVFRAVDKGGFISRNSVSPQSVFMIVKRLAKQAGLGNISPHDLRRTFAKLAHKGHAQLEQIQLSLGHSSIQTTERYLGISQDLTDAPCDHLGIKL